MYVYNKFLLLEIYLFLYKMFFIYCLTTGFSFRFSKRESKFW